MPDSLDDPRGNEADRASLGGVLRTAGRFSMRFRCWGAVSVWLIACGCSKTNSAARGQPSSNASAHLRAEPGRGGSPNPSSVPQAPAARLPNAPVAAPAFAPLAADCREPRVAAANAPLSALARSGWNWPWVTQTLLAYETRFVFEPSEIGDVRRVTLHQREVKARSKAAGRAELVAACRTAETCNELAKVLRDSIPGNRAAPYCATQPEPDDALSLAWSTLLPPLPESAVAGNPDRGVVAGPHDVEKACVRWAVCSRQQEPARLADQGLACLKDPNRYERERRCASGATCFDVAECAGQSTRAGAELPLWRDFEAEAGHREAFWLAGRALYSPGGDTLTPAALYNQTIRDLETWQRQKSPGRWFTVATGYDASNPTDLGSGQTAMQSTSGTWQLQYVTLERTVFGPVQTASGEGDNVSLVPSFHSTLRPGGEELLYDYDSDGVPEVGVYQTSWHHSLPPHLVLGVWTVKQGRIQPYAPAAALSAVGVTDVDGDDRPDLLLDSRDEFLGPGGCSYTGDLSCMAESHSSLEPDGVAHALPNGSFSTKDAVAQRAARGL